MSSRDATQFGLSRKLLPYSIAYLTWLLLALLLDHYLPTMQRP
jgi:heme O synthase-like polyprenyltransferase